ncbi:MAG: ZIP family metal transporter [Flavobacteriaceae bacterium]|nr:ZIP family metal transporter [Bacteroidia bacterium]NNF74644.1 ZIP family metal transporter [Flavobacteriaceae bacterium]NNK74041.1 ZIP family metal transporter [Flavobacteriaceae bacterium]
MNNYLFPVYAVLIGFVLVKLSRDKPMRHIKLLLAFSGAFLLSLTVFELLPRVYEKLDAKLTGLLIMSGILLQIFLEFFSKGAEHGHIHLHKHEKTFPWLLFLSLCLHAFLEGFPIHQENDMVYGVLIHKIPIAVLIISFLIQSKFNNLTIAFAIIIFSAMTPIGTWISNSLYLSDQLIGIIDAIVIGIFFHISTIILFESSEGHRFNLQKIVVIVSAVAIAYFV